MVKEALPKDKIVDPLGGTLAVGLKSEVANRIFPAFALEIQRQLNIHVPPAAGEQEVLLDRRNRFDGMPKVPHEQDVAIHVTKNIVSGELLGLVKDAGQIIRSIPVFLNGRDVPDPQLAAGCSGALFVAEQDHFHIGMEVFPALQRIALNDGNVSNERLWRSEEGDHGCAPATVHRNKTENQNGQLWAKVKVGWDSNRGCLTLKRND